MRDISKIFIFGVVSFSLSLISAFLLFLDFDLTIKNNPMGIVSGLGGIYMFILLQNELIKNG